MIKQHAEIVQLVTTVNHSEAVWQLIVEGDRVLGEDHNALRQAWEQDVTERLEYEQDQNKTGTVCVLEGEGRGGRGYTYTCMCVYMSVYVHVCACACVCVCVCMCLLVVA